MHPQLDRVTSPEYLTDLPARSIEDLRALRTESQATENALSSVRRLVQARLDILSGELDRRRDGGDPADLAALVAQLPQLLADGPRGTAAQARAPQELDTGDSELTMALTARVDELVSPGALSGLAHRSDDDVRGLRASLQRFETSVSEHRRAVHDALDALQAEITRRYRTGEASVDTLLQ
jgi:hypothetical protein